MTEIKEIIWDDAPVFIRGLVVFLAVAIPLVVVAELMTDGLAGLAGVAGRLAIGALVGAAAGWAFSRICRR